MRDIQALKVKGIDPNRYPILKNKNYIDIIFELSAKAPSDWCTLFNNLFSKDRGNVRIDPTEGYFIETWVRNMEDIPNKLQQIKENVRLSNQAYMDKIEEERKHRERSQNTKATLESDKLDQIINSLDFD